jgi:hypothetical protein
MATCYFILEAFIKNVIMDYVCVYIYIWRACWLAAHGG